MRIVERIAKLICLILCPFLGYGFGIAILDRAAASNLPTQFVPFLLGMAAFYIFWIFFRRPFQIVCTFEHEVTHLIFGLFFLKWPSEFVVTFRKGGHVTLSGSNFVIYLAPYFFPTVSYLLIPFFFVIPKGSLPIFYAVLGASVSFHLVSTWAELHLRQTDLQKAGYIFSLIFLPVANLIFYGALLVLIFGSTKEFMGFWKDGISNALKLAGL
jgi:hypothetical protein